MSALLRGSLVLLLVNALFLGATFAPRHSPNGLPVALVQQVASAVCGR